MSTPTLQFNIYQEVLYGRDREPAKVIAIRMEKDTVSYNVRCHRDDREILCEAKDLLSADTNEKDPSELQEQRDGSRMEVSSTNEAKNEEQSDPDFEGSGEEESVERKESSDRKRPGVPIQPEARKKAKDDKVVLDELLESVLKLKDSPAEATPPPILPKPATPVELAEVKIGCRIEVFWPDDDKFYPATVTGQSDESTFNLCYDHGEKEWLDLAGEAFRVLKPTPNRNAEVLSLSQENLPQTNAVERSKAGEAFRVLKPTPNRNTEISSPQANIPQTNAAERAKAAIQRTSIVEEPNESDVCFLARSTANTQGTAEYRSLIKEVARSHKSWGNKVYKLVRKRLGHGRRFLIPTTDPKTGRKYWTIAQEDEIKQKITARFKHVQHQRLKAKKSTALNKTPITFETAEDPFAFETDESHELALVSPETKDKSRFEGATNAGVGHQMVSFVDQPTVEWPVPNQTSPLRVFGPTKPLLSHPLWKSFMDFAIEQIGLGKDDMAIWRQAKDQLQVGQDMSFYALTLIKALRTEETSDLDWTDKADKDAFAGCLAKTKARKDDTSSLNVRLLLEEAFSNNLEKIKIAREAADVDHELVNSLNLMNTLLGSLLDVHWSSDLYQAIKEDGHEQHPGVEAMAFKMQGAEPHFCKFLQSLTHHGRMYGNEAEPSSSPLNRRFTLAILFLSVLVSVLWSTRERWIAVMPSRHEPDGFCFVMPSSDVADGLCFEEI